MALRANLLAALIYLKTRGKITEVQETPMTPQIPFEESYLDLPDYVTQVISTEEGFYTEPNGYALPCNTIEIYQELMSSKAWFSKAMRHLTEEEWVICICADAPLKTFERTIRKKELKFTILRGKKD